MRIARGNTKTGRFALEEDLRKCLAHYDKGGGFAGAAEDGQQPEGPAPALASCKEAADNRAEQLNTDQSPASKSRGGGQLTGPANGPKLNNAVAKPLFAGRVTSAIVPPPIASGMPPAQPEMKRKTMNCAMFLLNALPIMKAMKTILAAWYTGNRPYASPMEERNMGPKARPSGKMVMARELTAEELTLKSASTPSIPGAIIVVAIFLHKSNLCYEVENTRHRIQRRMLTG